jgi:hypothetical protein
MTRINRTMLLCTATLIVSACVGQRQARPAAPEAAPRRADSNDAPPAESPPDGERAAPPTLPASVAQAIRRLPWSTANCRDDTALNRALRLDFQINEGWSCGVENVRFADLTNDGAEEAIVELELQHSHVERLAGGETAERRLRSTEFVVITLANDQPELLVHITSDQGDITDADVVDGELSIELQGCWDCGCDIYREVWRWTGHRFDVDEDRSVQVYEAPDCGLR